MYKKLKEHVFTLIILITFLLDLGVIQPITPEPFPAPVVCTVPLSGGGCPIRV